MRTDAGKAQLFLKYLAKAYKHVQEREIARDKVQTTLRRLKKISTKEMHQELEVLEARIVEALKKEDSIAQRHTGDAQLHADMQAKIDALQEKLGAYLRSRENRESKLRELESKIFAHSQPRAHRLDQLKSILAHLEKRFHEEKSSGDHSKDELAEIASQITRLKGRIAALERKSDE